MRRCRILKAHESRFRLLLEIPMKNAGHSRHSSAFAGICELILIVLVCDGIAIGDDVGFAELVVLGADIRTQNSEHLQASAMAIERGRIVTVGDDAMVTNRIGPRTRVIRAQGDLILPGFNDSHVHFLQGGLQLSNVQLRDAATPEEFTRRIRDFAMTIPKGQWILGGDWDHENWPEATLPRRQWIDEVTPDNPVFISRLDGHMALANSLALQLGNISMDTPSPDGGQIVKDAMTGELTGVLKDAAMSLVSRRIPEKAFNARLAAARAATQHAASLGVTSVQDMSGADDIDVYRELQRRGELKTRIYAFAPLPRWKASAEKGLKAACGDDWIREGGLKGFADGSLGSTTALFFDAYHDSPETAGLPGDEMFPNGAMLGRILGADRSELQIAIHAIGDRANDQILTLFDQVSRTNGNRDRRFRIEHAQHLRGTDVPRFSQIGVVASMQPYHCADDGRWALKRIGPDRARGTYAFRSLIDSGAELAFGSDWNVAPLDPLQGIAAAVTRRTLDGRNPDGWVPEQKISVEEAVRAYTVGSAKAEFAEHDKGKLQAGMLADFVMLSQNIYKIPPEEISRATVQMTVVHGEVVFERGSP
jgi:predicted amidohydrolase YtcJ